MIPFLKLSPRTGFILKTDATSANFNQKALNNPGRAKNDATQVGAWGSLRTAIVKVVSGVKRWLRFKRVCAWHPSGAIYLGGNPFARHSTHGICPDCERRQRAEIEAFNAPENHWPIGTL